MSQAYKPFEFDRVFAEDGTVLRDGHGANNRMLTREEADAHAAEAVDAARKSDEAQASREAADALRHAPLRPHEGGPPKKRAISPI